MHAMTLSDDRSAKRGARPPHHYYRDDKKRRHHSSCETNKRGLGIYILSASSLAVAIAATTSDKAAATAAAALPTTCSIGGGGGRSEECSAPTFDPNPLSSSPSSSSHPSSTPTSSSLFAEGGGSVNGAAGCGFSSHWWVPSWKSDISLDYPRMWSPWTTPTPRLLMAAGEGGRSVAEAERKGHQPLLLNGYAEEPIVSRRFTAALDEAVRALRSETEAAARRAEEEAATAAKEAARGRREAEDESANGHLFEGGHGTVDSQQLFEQLPSSSPPKENKAAVVVLHPVRAAFNRLFPTYSAATSPDAACGAADAADSITPVDSDWTLEVDDKVGELLRKRRRGEEKVSEVSTGVSSASGRGMAMMDRCILDTEAAFASSSSSSHPSSSSSPRGEAEADANAAAAELFYTLWQSVLPARLTIPYFGSFGPTGNAAEEGGAPGASSSSASELRRRRAAPAGIDGHALVSSDIAPAFNSPFADPLSHYLHHSPATAEIGSYSQLGALIAGLSRGGEEGAAGEGKWKGQQQRKQSTTTAFANANVDQFIDCPSSEEVTSATVTVINVPPRAAAASASTVALLRRRLATHRAYFHLQPHTRGRTRGTGGGTDAAGAAAGGSISAVSGGGQVLFLLQESRMPDARPAQWTVPFPSSASSADVSNANANERIAVIDGTESQQAIAEGSAVSLWAFEVVRKAPLAVPPFCNTHQQTSEAAQCAKRPLLDITNARVMSLPMVEKKNNKKRQHSSKRKELSSKRRISRQDEEAGKTAAPAGEKGSLVTSALAALNLRRGDRAEGDASSFNFRSNNADATVATNSRDRSKQSDAEGNDAAAGEGEVEEDEGEEDEEEALDLTISQAAFDLALQRLMDYGTAEELLPPLMPRGLQRHYLWPFTEYTEPPQVVVVAAEEEEEEQRRAGHDAPKEIGGAQTTPRLLLAPSPPSAVEGAPQPRRFGDGDARIHAYRVGRSRRFCRRIMAQLSTSEDAKGGGEEEGWRAAVSPRLLVAAAAHCFNGTMFTVVAEDSGGKCHAALRTVSRHARLHGSNGLGTTGGSSPSRRQLSPPSPDDDCSDVDFDAAAFSSQKPPTIAFMSVSLQTHEGRRFYSSLVRGATGMGGGGTIMSTASASNGDRSRMAVLWDMFASTSPTQRSPSLSLSPSSTASSNNAVRGGSGAQCRVLMIVPMMGAAKPLIFSSPEAIAASGRPGPDGQQLLAAAVGGIGSSGTSQQRLRQAAALFALVARDNAKFAAPSNPSQSMGVAERTKEEEAAMAPIVVAPNASTVLTTLRRAARRKELREKSLLQSSSSSSSSLSSAHLFPIRGNRYYGVRCLSALHIVLSPSTCGALCARVGLVMAPLLAEALPWLPIHIYDRSDLVALADGGSAATASSLWGGSALGRVDGDGQQHYPLLLPDGSSVAISTADANASSPFSSIAARATTALHVAEAAMQNDMLRYLTRRSTDAVRLAVPAVLLQVRDLKAEAEGTVAGAKKPKKKKGNSNASQNKQKKTKDTRKGNANARAAAPHRSDRVFVYHNKALADIAPLITFISDAMVRAECPMPLADRYRGI